ncbi:MULTISPECIES: hypothetical protein [Hydrocarboniphaga]|jgi:hypothetical protein|uniref:Uncharacterized protein n=1 Tax=Hydrocarboniphaga effusa AP103 TaxID=1172194 RepID=I7ZIK2_9GAMM|nr:MULTISPECIES: hypothetical protein [Hydrocarboniphaga]EIT71754.1 hypothetical protein WQQ_18910 [Hydrocarboniphaga effusa AP103]MDZ4080377.1 hypothetical protein [Hydrocarboniphaga sp.]
MDDDLSLARFCAIAFPILMALVAIGVLLRIKITRRLQPHASNAIDRTVPAEPLSAHDARAMWRRYWWSVAFALALIVVAAIAIFA